MVKVARNAFKGYVYQAYVTTLFVAIMDSKREIIQLEAETIVDHKFDDLSIQADKNFYLQIKDYPETTLDDITISGKEVTIKNARDPILEMLKHYEFTIYDVYPKDPIVKHLDELGIIYSFGNYANTDEKYEPLRYGAIHESDFNYIKENGIGYLETSLLRLC